eukprot:CAMPEP_0183360906 /NCGR_PEP_ID=MMETSP0164_2-20130417/56141_1 /TAXON_ID=221442 /ORGANISM="Coccolithus pelagicus ssp braarudi, Strain PLY182g" /LENGTH=171 /DNA_ID=CAMNT_0025535353 /DNA_START=353 /DNA_END=868 /DNA_ORIENTATION=+
MIGFQLYELTCAILLEPSLRGQHNEMLAHHVAALLLAVLGVAYTYLHYYAPFFMGAVEVSSVPLIGVDFFKEFKGLRKEYLILHELSRALFAVLFVLCRVAYWPFVTYHFWCDSMLELRAAWAGDIGPPIWVVLIFCASNLLLSALQFYWGSLVSKALVQKVLGDEAHKED